MDLTYASVPKDREENLRYRAAIIRLGDTNPNVRPAILKAAADDFLWFCNTFCWVFEPRPEKAADGTLEGKIKPFITWPHQDAAYHQMAEVWGFEDIGVIKSRAEGASWVILMMMLHGWRFGEMEAYGLVSRNEKMVDNPRDPNALMWKLDWQLKRFPQWLVDPKDVDRNRNEHALIYLPTGSSIVGNAATGDVARGGRATVFLMDEFAAFKQPDDAAALDATRDVSNCRIFLSTPQGPIGAYYEIMRNKSSSMRTIGLWWYDNPTKNPGLYRVIDGVVHLVDLPYWCEKSGLQEDDAKKQAARVKHLDDDNPFGYAFFTEGEFVKSGALRSPWYDKQCLRPGSTARSIAQELDGDFGGSMSRFFSTDKIEPLMDQCRTPLFCGDLHYEVGEPNMAVRMVESSVGTLKIFSQFLLGALRPTPGLDVAIGADIAGGAGTVLSSNSCLQVICKRTRRQLAELATPNVPPTEFAELAAALGYFYRGSSGLPVICPERNGMGGTQFVTRLRDIGYPNIYEQKSEDRRTRKTTKKLGFLTQRNTKAALLGELNRAICAKELLVESRACLDETKQYMVTKSGAIEHVGAVGSDDPSGAGEAHGDRVIALALAWKAATEYSGTSSDSGDKLSMPTKLSFAGRMQAAALVGKSDREKPW